MCEKCENYKKLANSSKIRMDVKIKKYPTKDVRCGRKQKMGERERRERGLNLLRTPGGKERGRAKDERRGAMYEEQEEERTMQKDLRMQMRGEEGESEEERETERERRIESRRAAGH